MESWDEMNFWISGEWDVIQERLEDLKDGYNPRKELLFSALDATPFDQVRVAIVGQDPYPDASLCTGVAFDIGFNKTIPPTLKNILAVYQNDLKYDDPKHGNLKPWCAQGVLLWNMYPTCLSGKPGSHHWPEWEILSREMMTALDNRGDVIFVFLGSQAQKLYSGLKGPIIRLSHPSPLGARKTNNPFLGSRLFSSINCKLLEMKLPTIDWRL